MGLQEANLGEGAQSFASTDPFRPAAGLASPHAQTLFAAFFRKADLPPSLERERWELPDGDFLWVDRLPAPAAAPHLLLLHGLEGSSRAGYIAALLRGAAARGWGAVAPNARSCGGGEPNRLPRFYHSGETTDTQRVIERIRPTLRGPLFAVGFSLGGNVLLRLLAAEGERSPLAAAAAVSAPLDLARCVDALDAGGFFPWLYRRNFLRSLIPKALAKAAAFPAHLDAERVRAVRGIRAYDDAVTAPLHGFRDAADYYERCSSGPVLQEIRRPTLYLGAADDPFIPATPLSAEAAANPHLRFLRTERGGHVGFVAGSPLRPRFWAEEQVLAFFDRMVGERSESARGSLPSGRMGSRPSPG